jgi:hypothetical protein
MPVFHKTLGLSLVAIFLVLFAWGTVFWIRNRDPGRLFWGLLAVGQVALGVQILVGATLFLLGNRRPWLHYSYGLFSLLVIIVAHRFAKRYEGIEWAVFAIAAFIVTGLLTRAYMTGVGMG